MIYVFIHYIITCIYHTYTSVLSLLKYPYQVHENPHQSLHSSLYRKKIPNYGKSISCKKALPPLGEGLGGGLLRANRGNLKGPATRKSEPLEVGGGLRKKIPPLRQLAEGREGAKNSLNYFAKEKHAGANQPPHAHVL
jgi:hypothetical protein